MTDVSRIWAYFALMTVVCVGLLVLLTMDGLSAKLILGITFITLGPQVLLFRQAWRQPKGSRIRNLFYRWSAACFLGLTLAHFVADRASLR